MISLVKKVLVGLMSFVVLLTSAQETKLRRTCGTVVPPAEWDQWFNKQVENYKQQGSDISRASVAITIPVIVHVIHDGSAAGTFPNISSNQIYSQISVLNNDFAGNGYNVASLASTGFSAIGAADTKISFCLARLDPSSQVLAEPGIDRVDYNTLGVQNPTTFGSPASFQSYMDNTVKPATIWDPTQYFNIWVSDINPGTFLLGYATFPAGSGLTGLSSGLGNPVTDGIWIWSKAFGNTGVLHPDYNKGRTAVHETGHWLGLRHIGGDAALATGDCNATDYCDDTPPQKGGFGGGTNGQNYGSPVYPLHVNACSSPFGDMFMNFMDYCDDAVLALFTPDQNDRMQTALLNGTFRSSLNASSASLCVGLPTILFAQNQQACLGFTEPISFQNSSIGSTTYSWYALPSAGVVFSPSASDSSPSVSYPGTGTYSIFVNTTNSVGISTSSTTIVVDVCQSILQSSGLETIQIIPSPADQSFTVVGIDSQLHLPFTITVFDLYGRKQVEGIKQSAADQPLVVDSSEFPDGLYLLILENGPERKVFRLIINH